MYKGVSYFSALGKGRSCKQVGHSRLEYLHILLLAWVAYYVVSVDERHGEHYDATPLNEIEK